MDLVHEKRKRLEKLCNKESIFSALAIDQRGALKKMIAEIKGEPASEDEVAVFKSIVSSQLTKDVSAILLDPEYGLPAAMNKEKSTGLLLAYEKTGYDSDKSERMPDLLPTWSAKRLKAAGADACKFLLYYDIDGSPEANEKKQAFVERIGSECQTEQLPFFLELLSYDETSEDNQSKEYARKKPHKVIRMMEKFSEPGFKVDVLKVEVPVNLSYVEGFGHRDFAYTKDEAQQYFREQSQSTSLPFVFLSAGVTTERFYETLHFGKEAGSLFNGVLCGRATWSEGVKVFVTQGEAAAINWMKAEGRKKIEALNAVLEETATPMYSRFK